MSGEQGSDEDLLTAGIRRGRMRLSFGTGAGALLIAGGAVAAALVLGSPGNQQTAPVTAAPGQTTATAAPERPAPATAAALPPSTEPAPTSARASVPPLTPAHPTVPSVRPALATPAALVPSRAGKKDFGHAAAVVDTTGGPCLSVDRLVELSGAAAAAWVAKHPNDAAMNDLGVIADEDGPSKVCLPLSRKPTLRLSVRAGEGMKTVTLAQLRQVFFASAHGDAERLGFDTVGFIRWHYDARGAVDQVTGWWTP